MSARAGSGGAWARAVGALVLAAMLFVCPGCETEEKVVRYKPFLATLEPALNEGMTLKYSEKPVLGDPRVSPADPQAVADNKIVREDERGQKTLIARSPSHVMQHVERCLDDDEDELLLEQMVAESTKNYYRAQGKDPIEFVQDLRRQRKEIAKLFARMPQGESSPTVILKQLPDRVWRIDLVGGYAKDMKLTRLWVQMERGQWRLMWVD
jgi:hypothetical protein